MVDWAGVAGFVTSIVLVLLFIYALQRTQYHRPSPAAAAEELPLISPSNLDGVAVWVIFTFKGTDRLRRGILALANKLFGGNIAWATHWTVMIERPDWYSYFELQRVDAQESTGPPVSCHWSILLKTPPESWELIEETLPLRHDSKGLLEPVEELGRVLVGYTDLCDEDIEREGNKHFERTYPSDRAYGVMNNNCQTFTYMISQTISPESRLMTELLGISPLAIRIMGSNPFVYAFAYLTIGMLSSPRLAALFYRFLQQPKGEEDEYAKLCINLCSIIVLIDMATLLHLIL
ncbi:hypothetical protein F5882DRAFT_498646 [Hyaloscypha sp. PMI_1271]|nr:hypothetical protein F5882DRAFT_498646 [Hyaloscypha sp. PMI_1271]